VVWKRVKAIVATMKSIEDIAKPVAVGSEKFFRLVEFHFFCGAQLGLAAIARSGIVFMSSSLANNNSTNQRKIAESFQPTSRF
jgi:hypothetical protein